MSSTGVYDWMPQDSSDNYVNKPQIFLGAVMRAHAYALIDNADALREASKASESHALALREFEFPSGSEHCSLRHGFDPSDSETQYFMYAMVGLGVLATLLFMWFFGLGW